MHSRLFRTTYLFPLLLLVAVGCAEREGADDSVDPTASPTLEIVGGDTIDWGEVGGGELVQELKLRNVGGGILEITNVKPSCGCTTAPLDKDKLVSGEEATMQVTMDVATRTGPTQKTITISTNDSTSPARIVYLKANVVRDVAAVPGHFIISGVQAGQTGTSSISLVNSGKDPVTIQPPKLSGSTVMRVSFDMSEAVTLAPGDSVAVEASVTTPDSKPTSVPVTFATDSPRTKEVRVTLNVSGAVAPSTDGSTVDVSQLPVVEGS